MASPFSLPPGLSPLALEPQSHEPHTPISPSAGSIHAAAAALSQWATSAATPATPATPANANKSAEWPIEEEPLWPHHRGIFEQPLDRVRKLVHPLLLADNDALLYVESLLLRLLAKLTNSPAPATVADVEERIRKTFPTPVDKWAVTAAQHAVDRGKRKANLNLPVDKVHSALKERLQSKVDENVSLFLAAVLEYIAEDILKVAGTYVKNISHYTIKREDVKVAMCADKVTISTIHMNPYYSQRIIFYRC